MIRQINERDYDSIKKLGLIVNPKFDILFDLNKICNESFSNIFVYVDDNIVKGFVHIENMYETMDIINIVVDPIYQHQHIGSKLMEYLIKNIEFNNIMLEVNEKNINAINLYKKFNFKEINRRKKYYGGDDAIIMEMVKWKMYTY